MEGNHLNAYGTFIKKGDHLFRTEAYLQFGDKDNILGTVIMLNPGGAKLKAPITVENVEIHNEINIDPTMQALIQLMKMFYDSDEMLQGRVYIYNLFSLQNTKNNDAIKLFENLWYEKEPFIKGFPKEQEALLTHLQNSPWTLIGWGCKSSKVLDIVRERWWQLIKQSNTPIIGKRGKSHLDFYHPRPQLVTQQIEYRNELKEQYSLLVEDKEANTNKQEQLLTIILNGNPIQEMPQIKLKPQDKIISNGNIIRADYIDKFNEGIGFYCEAQPLPVAYIENFKTTVYIEFQNIGVDKIACIIKYDY